MPDLAPPPDAELPLAANGEVKAFDRLGNKVTVPKEQVGQLYGMGGRVAKKTEVAEQQVQETYDKQSTATKVAVHASMLGPIAYPLHGYLRSQGAVLDPRLEAYKQGVSEGLSGGLASVGEKEALRYTAGDGAAKAYAETADTVKRAHAELYRGGEIAGFLGGATAGGPISGVGSIAEKAAARGLIGVAERGVIGKAVAAGGALAARGAAEGAIYGAANQVSADMLGDHELAADKLLAATGLGALGGAVGGGVLGAGGSLASSGISKAAGAARGALSRAVSGGEEAVGGLASKAETAAADAAKASREGAAQLTKRVGETGGEVAAATGTKPLQEVSAARSVLNDLNTVEGQKGLAYDQAWNAIGKGNGLQSPKFAAKADRYLENGTRDVGEVLMRKGIINADDGIVAAMKGGTAADMLPKIAQQRAIVGSSIGDLTAASPAKIKAEDVAKAFADVGAPYQKMLGQRQVGEGVLKIGQELMENVGAKAPTDSISIQQLLEQRQTLDNLVYKETKAMDPGGRIEALREVRGKLEGLITKSLDEASGDASGELAAKYKALKKDYTALSIAHDLAEDSAIRASKGASLGLRDMMFGGGGISGLVMGAGHKILRERGSAGAAVLLYRMADAGTLTKAVASVDELIGRAATGLTEAPKRTVLPDMPTETPRVRAEKAMTQVAKFQANPEAFVDNVQRQTEGMATHSPAVAGAVQQRFIDTMAFLAGKVPVAADPDPFDPHPMPKLTEAQVHDLAAYSYYTERPSRFLEEAAHGKYSFEGAEVAQTLMPRAFGELQTRIAERMVELRAAGLSDRIPYEQQRKIGAVMQFAAVPEQRPDHAAFLQANVQPLTEDARMAGASTAPRKPFKVPTQPSVYDRLSEKGPGRR